MLSQHNQIINKACLPCFFQLLYISNVSENKKAIYKSVLDRFQTSRDSHRTAHSVLASILRLPTDLGDVLDSNANLLVLQQTN